MTTGSSSSGVRYKFSRESQPLRLSLLFPWSTAPGILSDPFLDIPRISGRVSSPNDLESGDVRSHHLESATQ